MEARKRKRDSERKKDDFFHLSMDFFYYPAVAKQANNPWIILEEIRK